MRASDRILRSGMMALALLALAVPALGQEPSRTFRVCADPNNLPFSNKAGEGFENKLAELIASSLGEKVTYDWHAQRRGFVRETLKAKRCDVVMGMPTHLDMIETTRPYYRSTYVFVSRADRHLDINSIKDPRLHGLKIGVQVIGDDGFNTPPSHALAQQGIIDNVTGFSVFGDYTKPNPPARIVTAVEKGDVDIVAVWGPLAGYFAKNSNVPLTVTPITDTESFKPLIFSYSISLGVRKHDDARKRQLDAVLDSKRPEITALLADYGIPTLPMTIKTGKNAGQPGADR